MFHVKDDCSTLNLFGLIVVAVVLMLARNQVPRVACKSSPEVSETQYSPHIIEFSVVHFRFETCYTDMNLTFVYCVSAKFCHLDYICHLRKFEDI